MDDEMKSIKKNETWKLVSPTKDCKPIGLKWVFKIQRDQNNQIQKYQAQLVVKGYAQTQGKDYDEVFAPVARIETIRIILAIYVQFEWLVYHLNVKTGFLNGEISEEIYVQQREGYEDSTTAPKSLNLLLSIISRSIFAYIECLKVRFR